MKTRVSRARIISISIAAICALICIFSVLTLGAGAAKTDGKRFNQTDLYKLNQHIMPNGSITFETEIYIPEAYRNSRGVLVSSYNGGSYKGGFAFEVGSSAGGCEGKIRVFSQTYGNVVVDHKITNYMGTDADPKFVKIAVTVDTSSTKDNVILYVNGEKKATATNASVSSTMYNTKQTFGTTEQSNLLSIGNDERLSLPFLGTMKSVAMYKGVRTENEIKLDHNGAFYDTSDENLIFALDGSSSDERFIEDKSANSNHAVNVNYKAAAGKTFSASELYKMQRNINPNGPITFETEIYIPVAMRSQRCGAIISNYDGGTYYESWAFEIMAGGNVRVFSGNHGDKTISYDVTKHMGNNDSNPIYAKIAVTVNTENGDIVLYVNGVKCASANNSDFRRTVNMYNTTSQLWIGGDGRPGNAQNFKGYIRSVALYKGIRTEAEIKLDYARTFYDTADSNLIFAHDVTLVEDGLIKDKSANKNHFLSASSGRAFSSSDEPMYSAKDYTEAPLSYEAIIYAPTNIDRTGVILGNYPNANGSCLNFEIYSAGKPSLYIYENGALRTNYKFNCDVRKNAWVHLVITQETVNGKDTVFKCYLDGELKDTYTQENYVYKLDMKELQGASGPISIGRDVRTAQVFKGRIMNVAIHNKTLTREEVKNSYNNGVNANSSSFIACYDMAGANATSSKIADVSGNGYDMQSLFYEKDFTTEEYDYSFAVVGDTQFLVYQDIINNTDYTKYIYDYIIDNYDAKKMKYVFGLGDITENGKYSDGSSSSAAEWVYAKDLIVNTLGANNIPYSLIGGNHDFMRPWDTGFNATFGSEPSLTKNITGYYQGTDIYNYYMNFEVEGTPYMLLALEYGANDDILAWANDIVGANKHRRVIVTTHGYMNFDGTTLDGGDHAAPKPNGTDNENYLKYNNGDEMWDEFIKHHANIAIVLSGHIDYNNIVMREDIGEHGNTVHQFLIDPQKMDRAYGFETGMVAMLYFRNGGKDVSVEYVSTYKTAHNNDKEVLFNGRNQFDFTIKEAPAQENKGEINVWLIGGQSNAVGYANGLTAEQLSDARYSNGFDNVLYYGYGEKWQSSFTPVKLGFGNTQNASGAELGIAAALGNTCEMNAIVKFAQGATALYPVTDSWAAQNFGTWTSPSYIKDKNVPTDGNLTGDLYVGFINTVESAVAELRRMGYTPIIKGMWWMQGEEETYNGGANSYDELLSYLTDDLRNDLSAAFDCDASKMPFVIGQIYTEKRPDLQTGIDLVAAKQKAFVDSDPYSSLVNPKNCPYYDTQDQWHFNSATQSYLGESFIKSANLINGESIVEIKAAGVDAIGGGLYKNGDTVTVTIVPKEGYEMKSLTMKVGDGEEVSVMDKFGGSEYSFVFTGETTTFTAIATSAYDVETGYGAIPKDYASTDDYPVILFTNENAFIGGYQNVTAAANKAMENPEGNYVILLRNDVSQSNGAFISNLRGSITLDLGGYTLTKASSPYLLEGYYGGGAFDGGVLTVKNGTLINRGWSALFCYNYGASLSGDVSFDFKFEDVRFRSEFASEVGKNVIFETWEDGVGSTRNKIAANVTFDECIFDYTGSAEGEIMLSLQARGGSAAVFNVTVNGGEIISDRTVGIADLAIIDNADTFVFGKGNNGYTVCTLPVGVDITAEQFNSANGSKLSYSAGSSVGGNLVYTLGEDVITEYGTIPYKFADANAYPFATFRNGSLVTASPYFGRDNAESALSYGKANGTVILMRRNFTYKESQYNNLSQTHSITIDLGGYTFTSTDRIVFSAQKKTTNNTALLIKNGAFVLGSQPLMRFSSWDPSTGGWEAYPGGNGFDFVFENVNIKLTSGSTTANILTYNQFSATDPDQFCNLTFNGCTFDLAGSANANVTLFDFTSSLCLAKAYINGGKIITNGITFVNLAGTDKNSSLTFGNAEGYTVISILNGTENADISKVYTTAEGYECVFVKTGESEGYVNYSLYPKALIGYKVKSSVTLHSGLVYNIYIPTANVLSFTVNGSTHEYETVELDGVEYYKVSVNLSAKEALSDINLKVNLKSGDTEVSATWTLSLVKYAEKVIGDTNAAEAKLVSDILSYARAAYDYFGVSDAEKISKVNALLGENYDAENAPVMNGSADVPSVGLKSATFVLNATPAVRFYLADGADASKYTFFADGKKLDFTEGSDSNGSYVEISVFAYLMGKTVEYRIDGIASGSYHIKSYYNYAKTLNNEKLVTLVERFAKYCESAEDYRLSVIEAEN